MIYYDKPYYLEPAKGAAKVYALLREALKRTKKAGVAKYVLHKLEHLGILKVEGNLLMLNQFMQFYIWKGVMGTPIDMAAFIKKIRI